jgi:hypothetical protein
MEITFTERQLTILRKFLERTEMRGYEVNEFLEIMALLGAVGPKKTEITKPKQDDNQL